MRLAHNLWWLGRLATDPRTKSDLFGRALALQEKLAPGSLAEGHTLLEWARGLRDETDSGVRSTVDGLLRRALPIFERFRPATLELSHVFNELGAHRSRARDPAGATEFFEKALRIREKAVPDSSWVASSLGNLGQAAVERGDAASADGYMTRAHELWRKLAPKSLGAATTSLGLANLRARQGQFESAKQLLREVVSILENEPASVAVANRYDNVAEVALQLGDTGLAATSFSRSVDILKAVAPSSSRLPATTARFARVLQGRGEGRRAEQLMLEGLRTAEKNPDSDAQQVEYQRGLGLLALDRGELTSAEAHLRGALAIDTRRHDRTSWATTANILASLHLRRGDYDGAEQLVREAIAITEKTAPVSEEMAILYQRLAHLALARGDVNGQMSAMKESLQLQEKLAENPRFKADTLIGIADLQMESGGPLDASAQLLERARALVETSHRRSSAYASALAGLGRLAIIRKENSKAEAFLAQALDLRLELGYPEDIANSHAQLGELYRDSGRMELAATHFAKSVDAIEAQAEQLGGIEDIRFSFTARYGHYYRNHMDTLLRLGQPAQAYQVAERSRARSLLRMLAERSVTGAADLPADLAQARARVAADYDRTQARIVELSARPEAQAETGALRAQLRALREERESIADQIRAKSPRFASLHYPQPLDLSASQATLDPGTVLLEYVVTSDKTFLFVLQPTDRVVLTRPPLSVFTLPAGEASIREQVGRFRSLIERDSRLANRTTSQAGDAGARLFDLLVKPARDIIAKADRILISPDGPLHSLPFAALSSGLPGRGGRRYFIEEKPLHIVISATVYAELRKTRRSSAADTAIAAFGDPVYPKASPGKPEAAADADMRSFVRRGLDLKPLPDSRVEVEAIGRLYGTRAAVYTGAQANEERAKEVAPRAAYLHFAMHGILDERVPLNSAIVFSLPEKNTEGRDNGLLQAWEILDQLRIDADLVTLSACETALGKEFGGEGLVGLTRAFQYAGARSVLASLWSVADKSTATLMTRFYRHLQSGRTKDEALRAAQIDMIRGSHSRPFHWAAFTLSGDWR